MFWNIFSWKKIFIFWFLKVDVKASVLKRRQALTTKSAALHCATSRLFHSLSLVAVGLSVGYETWPPIGWNRPFEISWSTCRLELPCVLKHFRLTWSMGIYTVLQRPLTVPLHSPNGKQMPAVRALKGDCEKVCVTSDQCVYMLPHSTNPNGLQAGPIRIFFPEKRPGSNFCHAIQKHGNHTLLSHPHFQNNIWSTRSYQRMAYPQYLT